ncbi:MAG: ABC transporter permease [Haloferacaceae archaeon]
MSTRTETGLPGLSTDVVTLGRLLVPVLVVLFWEALTLWLGADLVPGPVETVGTIVYGFTQGSYTSNLTNTLLTVLIGFVLAVVFGFGLGVALGVRQTAYDLFEPFVLNTYAIPKIVLFPFFLFVFRLGMDQKVAFGAFHGFFPMLIITMSAVREVPDIYLDVGRSLRLGRLQMARHVVFPFVLVQVVVGLRLAFSLTFLGVILAELFAAKSGIGLQLSHAMANFNTDQIMAIVTVLMVIAFVVNIGFYAVQRMLEQRWNLNAEDTV